MFCISLLILLILHLLVLATVCVISAQLPRFVIPGDIDLDDQPYEDFLSHDVELERKAEKEMKNRQELLAKVDFSRYTNTAVGCLFHYLL